MKKKILIVEDDATSMKATAVLLKSSGYDVIGASDGIRCMSMALKEKPDLIILDLGLPAGDGFTVLKRLNSHVECVGIPVIVVTGWEASENEERAQKEGAVAYLQKPVDNNDLLENIRKVLGETV